MKKLIAVAALALAGAVAVAGPAYATDAPPQYTIVALKMPSWIDPTTPTWPQTLVTSKKIDVADLSALDAELPCGSALQIDIHHTGPIVDSLIAGGYLNGPNSPQEDLIDGGWGTAYKLVLTPDCVQPPDESTPGSSEVLDCAKSQWVITNWHDVVTYSGDAHGYTANAPVRIADPDTSRPATATECPPPPAGEPDCGTAKTLACSPGGESLWWQAPLAGSGILLGLGILFRRKVAAGLDRLYFR